MQIAPMPLGRINIQYRRVECEPPADVKIYVDKNYGSGLWLRLFVTVRSLRPPPPTRPQVKSVRALSALTCSDFHMATGCPDPIYQLTLDQQPYEGGRVITALASRSSVIALLPLAFECKTMRLTSLSQALQLQPREAFTGNQSTKLQLAMLAAASHKES